MTKKTKKPKRVTLAAFAKARHEALVACIICKLPKPLRREIDAGIKEGVQNEAIVDWLRKAKVAISEKSVRRHRRNHVEAI